MADPVDRLSKAIEKQAERQKMAEEQRSTVLGHTVYIGTLGLLFVLPVVGGAYLGVWLDNMVTGYSVRWTISLILVGVFVGAVNVYLFVRE
jgi:ATP synthase protein I